MRIRSLVASDEAERAEYASLAEGWGFVATIAAQQDASVARRAPGRGYPGVRSITGASRG